MVKAIYIRMPRCGSTSLVSFCQTKKVKYFGGWDMGLWCREIGWRRNSGLFRSSKSTSKFLYKCVLNHVGEKAYKENFTFSSVRNPYSRAVSMYKHPSWKSVKTFKQFCGSIKKNLYPSEAAEWHTSSLTEHLVDKDTLKVDFVIKLENFQQDFNMVCDKIGIPHTKLPHKNRSKHKPYTEYYDDETRQIVSEKYARDIEYFGYKFGS